MAKNYRNIRYLDTRPDVNQIFTDLELLLEFCKTEMLPFNEADLYNKHSRVWQRYETMLRRKEDPDYRPPRRKYNNNNNHNNSK